GTPSRSCTSAWRKSCCSRHTSHMASPTTPRSSACSSTACSSAATPPRSPRRHRSSCATDLPCAESATPPADGLAEFLQALGSKQKRQRPGGPSQSSSRPAPYEPSILTGSARPQRTSPDCQTASKLMKDRLLSRLLQFGDPPYRLRRIRQQPKERDIHELPFPALARRDRDRHCGGGHQRRRDRRGGDE